MSEELPEPAIEKPDETPIMMPPVIDNKPAADSRHPVVKWLDNNKLALAGFFGWYILNGLCWGLYAPILHRTNPLSLALIFPINLLTLLVLAASKPTRKIALGILIALALNFALSLLAGMFVNGICFIPFYLVEMPK